MIPSGLFHFKSPLKMASRGVNMITEKQTWTQMFIFFLKGDRIKRRIHSLCDLNTTSIVNINESIHFIVLYVEKQCNTFNLMSSLFATIFWLLPLFVKLIIRTFYRKRERDFSGISIFFLPL